jgi:hypothetical protein
MVIPSPYPDGSNKFPQTNYAVSTEPFYPITQQAAVIPYRRFGTTYHSSLQMSRIQKDIQAENDKNLPFLQR